jgi:NitT/TauT family transport system ATP-binding protein
VDIAQGHAPPIVTDRETGAGQWKVRIAAVGKKFRTSSGDFTALGEVSADIGVGEFVSIVGPSGCGKTTLLRIMAGLESPTSGAITIRQTGAGRPANSVVFQEASIFPWMTTRRNAEYGLAMRGVPAAERRATVQRLLETVGLAQFAEAYPKALSGGMKQRVSLVRAFANDPEILLMDEPFGAVDEQTRIVLQEELLRIWDDTGKTVVFVTHSIQEALTLSDRVIVMGANPGRIQANITVPFERPRDVYRLKAEPHFGELEYEIWQLLRKEPQQRRDAGAHHG